MFVPALIAQATAFSADGFVFLVVKEHFAAHERELIAPAGDGIRRFLPKDEPTLILIDELTNYVSRSRRSGLSAQLYTFLHNLSEEARGRKNLVLAVSIPASELEMNAEDQADHERLKKLLDRVGKPVIMSADRETSEIIRRRLFDWGGLDNDAKKTCGEYADWVSSHRLDLQNSWFPMDHAREAFEATYPFHPMTLSVFERKWQALPRFQQTRGVLRLLALWTARVYRDGFEGKHRDPLIDLGTAPLDDILFRTAAFEQLGDNRLEGAVTADIMGKRESHAFRLDGSAGEAVKKARLHRRVATVVFFESNGGQARAEATPSEIRLAVAEPDLDLGHVETVLEALTASCYYLDVQKNRYRFQVTPNLNKLLADRRANIEQTRVDDKVLEVVREVFLKGKVLDPIFFPERSNQIPDRAALVAVVLSPHQSLDDEPRTRATVEAFNLEYGSSNRRFRCSPIWCVAATGRAIADEARKCLAWQDIRTHDIDRLDPGQRRQLDEHLALAKRDLTECVWRSYKNVFLLGKDGSMQNKDLGLVHSSAAASLAHLVLNRLQQDGDIEAGAVSPSFLVRHWPPAFVEWSTKSVRDAFFASPQLPRLMKPDELRNTIARGVEQKLLAYVGPKDALGRYRPFHFGESLNPDDVELSDDTFIVTGEVATRSIEPPRLSAVSISPTQVRLEPGATQAFRVRGADQHGRDIEAGPAVWAATGGSVTQSGLHTADDREGGYSVSAEAGGLRATADVSVVGRKVNALPDDGGGSPQPDLPGRPVRLSWEGQVPTQKWNLFYSKVLSNFRAGGGLKVTVRFELDSDGAVSPQKIEEAKVALRELGLGDRIEGA